MSAGTGLDTGGDDQDRAEQLDESEIALDPLDQNIEDYPPDQLLGADRYGITPQQERVDEPVAERDARYEPDVDELAEAADAEADPVWGEPAEVPTDPDVLDELGEEDHMAPLGEDLEPDIATETEAYDSEG